MGTREIKMKKDISTTCKICQKKIPYPFKEKGGRPKVCCCEEHWTMWRRVYRQMWWKNKRKEN